MSVKVPNHNPGGLNAGEAPSLSTVSPFWLAAGLLAWLLVSELVNALWLPWFSVSGINLLTVLSVVALTSLATSLVQRRQRFWRLTARRSEEQCALALQQKAEAEAHLADCLERYRRLVELSPDAIVLHQDGRLVLVNKAAVDLVGGRSEEDLLGREVMEFVSPESQELVAARIQRVLAAEGQANRAEVRLRRLDGQPVDVESMAVRLLFQGRPAVLAILRDITERRRMELTLKESEDRFRSIFMTAPIGIGLMELDGRGLEINPAFVAMLGYDQKELCRLTTEDLLHPEDVPERHRLLQEIREGRRQGYMREARYIHKDGHLVWTRLIVSLIPGQGGRPPLLMVMAQDITQEKETAAQLEANQARLRALATELSVTEERQRRELAADLHDHVGQPLALAKIKLSALKEILAWEGRGAALEEAIRYLDEAIAASRSLTSKLSPPMLFEGKLEETLAWLAEQIEQRHGLKVTVQGTTESLTLPEPVRIILFRAVKELLTNVVKHARARWVQIFLDKQGPELCITMQDDGIGFSHEEVVGKGARPRGFGLFSLRERLGQIGARLDLSSRPGQGTTVRLWAPLKD